MSEPVPIRRRTTGGKRPGRIIFFAGDTQEDFDVTDWGLSTDNQTLSLWFADKHEEHLILGAGDRYAFYPA
jgi:hypothetical protein